MLLKLLVLQVGKLFIVPEGSFSPLRYDFASTLVYHMQKLQHLLAGDGLALR